MSRQKNPDTMPGASRSFAADEIARTRKGRRDKDAKPTVADFPAGRELVAEHQDRDGFQVFFRCRVEEAYADPTFSGHDDHGLAIFARVLAVSHPRVADCVGRLVRVGLSTHGWWWNRGPRLSRLPLAEFRPAMCHNSTDSR